MQSCRSSLCVFLLSFAVVIPAARAETTKIDVRVRSQGAKFVGTSMGGARVVIREHRTGKILAEGITRGSTGDTGKIMKTKHGPEDLLSTPDAAVFSAELDLDRPTQLLVEALGPVAQPQATAEISVTQWVVPGKHITGGDGLLLTLPGFAVDVLSPPAHMKLSGVPQTIDLRANVVLMCGCPTEPGGLWDSDQYEIAVILERNGQKIAIEPLKYAGETSRFQRTLKIEEAGTYEATVYAYNPNNGNTGIDKTTFIVSE